MKHMKILYILSFLVLFSCNRRIESPIVEFDEFSFELPVKVIDLKKSLGLNYGYYVGFTRQFDEKYKISTQLEGQPVFLGSDNDNAESYFDKNIVGVTFEYPKDSFYIIKQQFAKKYKSEFKMKTINSSWIGKEYWILNNLKNLSIVLIDNYKNQDTLMSISFYSGIKQDNIENFINQISNKGY
jgi:hypothetical protein